MTVGFVERVRAQSGGALEEGPFARFSWKGGSANQEGLRWLFFLL